MIEVNENISFGDIEEKLIAINKNDSTTFNILLDLPISTDFKIGVLSSLIQFFITISKRGNYNNKIYSKINAKSLVNVFENEPNCAPHILTLLSLNNFHQLFDFKSNKAIGLTPIYCMNNYQKLDAIYRQTKNYIHYEKSVRKDKNLPLFPDTAISESVKENYKTFLEEYIKSIAKFKKANRVGLNKNNNLSLFFGCFDHLVPYDQPTFFYEKNRFKDNSYGAFEEIVKIFLSITSINEKNEIIQTELYKDLSTVIFELVENTERWGKDYLNDGNAHGVRGALLTLNLINDNQLLDPQNPINEYVNNYKYKFYNKDSTSKMFNDDNFPKKLFRKGFFEVSVIDSGLGFVSKYIDAELESVSFEEECNIFLKCFKKSFSLDTSNRGNARGLGLSSVMSAINKKGFIKVRTGRISAYRNLMFEKFEDEEYENGITFKDWLTNTNQFTIMPKVEGTLITIIYPFSI